MRAAAGGQPHRSPYVDAMGAAHQLDDDADHRGGGQAGRHGRAARTDGSQRHGPAARRRGRHRRRHLRRTTEAHARAVQVVAEQERGQGALQVSRPGSISLHIHFVVALSPVSPGLLFERRTRKRR